MNELFTLMKKDNVKADLESYAALFLYYSQKECPQEDCTHVITELTEQGLYLEDIFENLTWTQTEKSSILQAILTAKPDFIAHTSRSNGQYDNPLFEEFNKPRNLDEVVERNPYSGVLTPDMIKRELDRQMDRELAGNIVIHPINARPKPSKKTLDYRKKLEAVKNEWRMMCIKGFGKKLKSYTRNFKDDPGLTLLPYLTVLKPEEYAECMMQMIEKVMISHVNSFSFLCHELGLAICKKYFLQKKIDLQIPEQIRKAFPKFAEEYGRESDETINLREYWQDLPSKEGLLLDISYDLWPYFILRGIGKFLFDVLLFQVKVDANKFKSSQERKMVPAFYTVYRKYPHKIIEEIKPNPVAVRLYQGSAPSELSFETSELPMLTPPIPWTNFDHGGYLITSKKLLRFPEQATSQWERLKKWPVKHIHPILDSLNILSNCPWVVNKPILDLMIEMFNQNGNDELDIPPPMSQCPPMPKITESMTSKEKAKVYQERNRINQLKFEMYSLWCSALYRLSIANAFRDDIFWFPHNLDFRSRTYPMPPYFNHLGGDVARGLLLFAKGKPLGEHGLTWLKIHLVNLTGFKKRTSNAERLAYADEVLDDIFDSADHPVTGKKWWQTSDEPWQTLACCKEIASAIRSPDYKQYVCHFPVHQDGSCNGLQHYAALGRDIVGAQSVNLCPLDSPQDVYSDVAEKVERMQRVDINNNVAIAKVLDGFIKRKVVKQTVMTTVYGVTRYGSRQQVLRQLKDNADFPPEHAWPASAYVAEKTFKCLREMFTAAKEIQDWLTLSAYLVSSIRKKAVEWITPLDLLVVQPYHKQITHSRHQMNLKDIHNDLEKPNVLKQKNGFPPNFIHSLDSSHMMLTALHCHRAGITYVSVHDCFWTHPSDVAVMNKICREQFVSLHNQPILEDLSRYLIQQFCPQNIGNADEKRLLHVLSKVPKRGDLDLKCVLASTYFFS